MYEVADEASLSPRVEVDYITQGPISEGRAVNGYLILPAPVVDAVLILDFLSDPSDYLRR